ncbi:hypothetical protein HDU96_004524 [Phlyctochytrium bullatum]|nr:hypothetical protein HDU96_004524 [Phlyctochytrium bullatum]
MRTPATHSHPHHDVAKPHKPAPKKQAHPGPKSKSGKHEKSGDNDHPPIDPPDAVDAQPSAAIAQPAVPVPAPKPSFDLSTRRLIQIDIRQLLDLLPEVYNQTPYTPLILDPSGRIDTFFQYTGGEFTAQFLDVKPILVATGVTKSMTVEAAREEMRRVLVTALRYGKTLVVRLANTAFDFGRFEAEGWFPSREVWAERGGVGIAKEGAFEGYLRDEDRQPYGVFVPGEGFRVTVTSSFNGEEYEEFLEEVLPLNKMLPIEILPN